MKKTVIYQFETIDTIRFNAWLKARGYNQHKIAKEIAVSQSDVSNFIQGKRKCTTEFIKWCEMYHYDLEPREMTPEEALDLIEDESIRMCLKKAFNEAKNGRN